MAIIQTLQSAGYVDVEVVFRRITLASNALDVSNDIFMHILVVGRWCLDLIVDGGVEGQCFLDDIQNLERDVDETSVWSQVNTGGRTLVFVVSSTLKDV